MFSRTPRSSPLPARSIALRVVWLLVAIALSPKARAAEERPPVGSAPDSTHTELPQAAEERAEAEAREPRQTVVVYERDPDDDETKEEIERRLWPDLDNLEPRYEFEDREGKTITFSFIARYDRVDELSGTFTQAFAHKRSFYPRFSLNETYSTGQDEWFYRLEFEQPILEQNRVVLGASVHDETTVFSDLIGRVGDGENTLAALFFKEDFRHYLLHEGVSTFVEGRLPGGPSLRIGYLDEDHRALSSTTNGSIFRPRTSFRVNPAADEGRLKAWRFALEYESASRRRSSGIDHLHAFLFETSSPNHGSDFDFDRWLFEGRIAWRLSVDQDVAVRLRTGGVISGTLPIQRAFFLGGLGTLRARDYGEFTGERCYLVNIEYGFSVFRQIQAVVFHDVGAAWQRPTSLGDTRPELDVGFALRNRSGRFRVNLARDLRARQAPLVVTVRLTHPF